MSNKNSPSSNLSNLSDILSNLSDKMSLPECRRELDELFSLLKECPEPDSTDLRDFSGRIDIEGLLARCLIEHAAGRLLRVEQKITRRLLRGEQEITNGSLHEQLISFMQSEGYYRAAAEEKVKEDSDKVVELRYPRLPRRRLPDPWLRLCCQLDEELRQYASCKTDAGKTSIVSIVRRFVADKLAAASVDGILRNSEPVRRKAKRRSTFRLHVFHYFVDHPGA